jgi:hypothetical protein
VERQRDWVTKIRTDPKGAMEADLYVCGFGLVIAVLGGLFSVTGYHPAWQSIHDNTPAPTAGSLIVIAGLFLVALGIILMGVNTVVWLGGRRRGRTDETAPGPVEQPSWTCRRGHTQALGGAKSSGPAGQKVECTECGGSTSLRSGVASGALFAAVGGILGVIAWKVGGNGALIVGGLALLVFLVGVWTMTVSGAFLLLTYVVDRSARRRKAYRSRRRRRGRSGYRR